MDRERILGEGRRVLRDLREHPPPNAPPHKNELAALERALNRAGAPHEGPLRGRKPLTDLPQIIKRVRDDPGLHAALADVLSALERVQAKVLGTPGRRLPAPVPTGQIPEGMHESPAPAAVPTGQEPH